MNNIYVFFIILLIFIIYIKINKESYTNQTTNVVYKWTTTKIEHLENTNKYKEDILSENPKIIYIHNFITEEEAKHIIKLADELKKPSTIDSKESALTLETKTRSSNTAHLGKSSDYVIKDIEKKASEYTNLNINYIEPLQVAVYEKGQKYNPHYDFFNADSSVIEQYGNRTKTILVYLNNLSEDAGGNTYFPKLDIRIKPKALDAIYFENMNDGNVNYDTLHAGEEILNNSKKYAINIWFREKEINFAN